MLAVDAHPGWSERDPKTAIEDLEKPVFHLRLLGGFELVAYGHEVRVPDATQKIVAFLAFQTASVRRGFVAGSLWTDHSDERAAANLRTALWRLPRELAGLVVGGRTTLALASTTSIDYRNALRVALSVLAGDNERFVPPGVELEALDNTLLPGWYDDWVVAERDRLLQIRLHVLEVLARNALNQGHYEDAIHLAQTVVRAEALRESGHLLLARAHLASGNRASAVRQIQRLDAILRSELGISASPEAWLIIENICENAPARNPLPSGVRP
jgi:DNA-binding SARP family transcriptional activator